MNAPLDKMPLHYETRGAGRPLLLLPGWTMAARTYAHIMEPYLSQRDQWQRFYIDPPGHGRSPGTPAVTNLDDMLALLLAWIDRTIPGQRFVLCGYSLGAYLARGILYHRRADVDGIAMLAPAIITQDDRRDVPDFAVVVEDPAVMDDLNDEERLVMESVVVRSQGMLETMRGWPVLPADEQTDYDYLQRIREDPTAYACVTDFDALDEPFPRPSLIITGRQDAAVGYKDAWRLLDNYPRATYAVLDRAGHFLEEQQRLVGPLLSEWLDRVEESIAGR